MALNTTLVKSTVVAALGGLLFGFDTAVIAGATAALTTTFQLSPNGLGITVSVALWGTVFGALLASIPGDRYGRRDSLRVMAIFYLVSALGCAFATNWYALLFFRFIGGVAIGGSSVLGPMYITEIAPAKWRGRLDRTISIQRRRRNPDRLSLELHRRPLLAWRPDRVALEARRLSSACRSVFRDAVRIPRSPRWLATQGRTAEARSVLEAIGEENIDSRTARHERSL